MTARALLAGLMVLAMQTASMAVLLVDSGELAAAQSLAAQPRFAAVGAVVDASSGTPTVSAAFANGVLVSDQWVLTSGVAADAVSASSRFMIGGSAYQISQKILHPQYTGGPGGVDLGLLRLSSPVTDVAPAIVNDITYTAGNIDELVTSVGFGVYDANTYASGLKLAAYGQSVSFDARSIYILAGGNSPAGVAYIGDCGAGAFVQRNGMDVVAGLYSDGSPTGEAYFIRTDTTKPWLDLQVGAGGITWASSVPEPATVLALTGLGIVLTMRPRW